MSKYADFSEADGLYHHGFSVDERMRWQVVDGKVSASIFSIIGNLDAEQRKALLEFLESQEFVESPDDEDVYDILRYGKVGEEKVKLKGQFNIPKVYDRSSLALWLGGWKLNNLSWLVEKIIEISPEQITALIECTSTAHFQPSAYDFYTSDFVTLPMGKYFARIKKSQDVLEYVINNVDWVVETAQKNIRNIPSNGLKDNMSILLDYPTVDLLEYSIAISK